MIAKSDDQGLSLYDAARSAGVTFADETIPKDKHVFLSGSKFHYLEWGNTDNPPMMLLHGFAQEAHSWDFVALSLCDRYRVVVPDQRGHGDSDWAPNHDYTPEAYQKDMNDIIEALDLRNIVMIGLSMGGRNSLTYAANHPDKVKALVIVDAGPENMLQGSQNIRRFVQQDDELDSPEAFVQRAITHNPSRTPEQVRGSIRHKIKQLPNGKWTWKYDRFLRSPANNLSPDPKLNNKLWRLLDNLRCPVLIVRGAQSNVMSKNIAEKMCTRIPNATLATVENAGHLVMGDNPSGFELAIGGFLANVQ